MFMDNKQRYVIYRKFIETYGLYIALALALCFFVQVFFGSLNKSLTWDEPSFISAGYSYLKYNDFRLNPSHPPLMQELEAFPLLFMNLQAPGQNDPVWQAENPVVAFGKKFFFENGNDHWKMTIFSRLPVMLIGTSMILLMYLWGRKLYGAIPALFACAVTSFSPNLIAHAKLATEDLGCAVFMFAAVWSFWLAIESKKKKPWIICGIVTGLALLTKFTALLLFPIYALLTLILLLQNRDMKEAARLFFYLVILTVISLVVVGAGYNFSFNILLYFRGMKQIYSDAAGVAYSVYFMGKSSPNVHWFYYLAAFVMKVPVPVLILLILSSLTFYQEKELWKKSIFLLLPALVIIFVSFFDKANLGLRRILPAFPFIYLFIAQLVFCDKFKYKRLALPLLIWTIFITIFIFPHHLSFFNIAAGGPKNGPYLFDDSNIDWGQDLPALAKLQQEKYQGKPFKLIYFGTAVPAAYGVKTKNFSFQDIIQSKPGIYAISAHDLVWFRKMHQKDGVDVDWLSKYTPSDYAGYSIYIYEH